jgi:uncharacterized RDD family membrane protein YckC
MPPPYGAAPAYPGGPYGQQPYGQAPYGALPYGGHALASWIERVGASLIDGVIAIIPALVVLVATGSMVGYDLIAFIGNMTIAYLNGSQGQSPGKRLLKLKVLRERDGSLIGGGMGIVRALAHILDALSCGIGYLWPLWDSKRQTFADKVIGTVVIKL